MIHKNIRKANTLEGDFYTSSDTYEKLLESVFLTSWQLLDPALQVSPECNCIPFELMPGSLNEPLLLTSHEEQELCISNVCTHRAMLIIDQSCKANTLRCPYHGRCFEMNGHFKSMPEFKDVENFPDETDNLVNYPIHTLGPMRFVSLDPKQDFNSIFAFVSDRVSWYPFERLEFKEMLSRDYRVNAHWALYCDNYLEGFHVPFVHEHLNKVLSYENYQVELFDSGVLQIGVSKEDKNSLAIPAGHPDHGQFIYAYYFFVFPNLMINIYHWGISVNLVLPLGKDKTCIRFLTYVRNDKTITEFEDTAIHNTEMEDEVVVEAVQKGVRSFTYKKGRFSPNQERGVHHFHRWLSQIT